MSPTFALYRKRIIDYYITITGSVSLPYQAWDVDSPIGPAALRLCQPVAATSCMVQPGPKTRALFLKPISRLLQLS